MEPLTSEESVTVTESSDPYIVKTETFVDFDTCQNQQIENERRIQVGTEDKVKTEQDQSESCQLMTNETLHHNQLTEPYQLMKNLHPDQLQSESCELKTNENQRTHQCELVNYDNLKTAELKPECCEFTNNENFYPDDHLETEPHELMNNGSFHPDDNLETEPHELMNNGNFNPDDHLETEPHELMNNGNFDRVQLKTETCESVNNDEFNIDHLKTEPCKYIDNSIKIETDFSEFSNVENVHESAFDPGEQWSGWNDEESKNVIPNFQRSNFLRGESVKMDFEETEQILEYQFMQSSSVGSYAVPRYKADLVQNENNSVEFENVPKHMPDQGTILSPAMKFEVNDTMYVLDGGVVKMEGEEILDVRRTENVSTIRKPHECVFEWKYHTRGFPGHEKTTSVIFPRKKHTSAVFCLSHDTNESILRHF
jgi:hypothetical protein